MRRKYSYMYFGKKKNRITLFLERKPRKNVFSGLNGFVGLVSSNRFKEDIALAVDEEWLDEEGVSDTFISSEEDGSGPVIVLSTAAFIGLKRGYPSDRFGLLHEVGHYCCDHLVNAPPLEEGDEQRRKLVAQNKVSETELAADAFAVEYLGAWYVSLAMADCIDQLAAEHLHYGIDDFTPTMREYQMRIDHIAEQFGFYDEDEEDD